MNSLLIVCCLLATGNPAPVTIDSALLTLADQAEVPARDAGLVAEIGVREGQVVKVGDLLAKLDDTDAILGRVKVSIELKQAQRLAGNDIKVRTAQRDLDFAKSEFQRAHQAEGRLPGSVSDAERDRLRLNVERASLDLQQAQFDLDAAKLAVDLYENELKLAEEKLLRRRIISPISGIVVVIPKHLGEWVQPGEAVVRVLAIDRLRVEFFLKASSASPDLVSKTVKFTLPGSETAAAFTGKVTFVNPEVDPLNGQVRVWAEIENRDGRLRPGLTGSLTIAP